MVFEVVPMGTAGTHTGPGRPCSGYLVRHDDTTILVDAGNGSTANLLQHVGFDDLDAVVITHRHLDHCADLIGMYYALRFDEPEPRTLPLYAAAEVLEQMVSMLSDDSRMGFTEAFRHTVIAPGDRWAIGGIDLQAFASVHPVPTTSLRLQADDRTLVYSSDSAGGDQLVRAAKDADVLLAEATWQGDAAAYPPGIHLTARQAARIAERADVDRLVLTHILGTLDREDSVAQASEIRPHVTAAVEHEAITI